MKKIVMIIAVLSGAVTARARAGMYSNKWEGNDKAHHTRSAAPRDADKFASTSVDVSSGMLTVSGLPEMPKPCCVRITDGEGELVKQKKISVSENQVNLSHFSKGLYFVTIVYRSEGQKTFAINL